MERTQLLASLAALILLGTATGCGSGSSTSGPSSPDDVRHAYVLMGPDGTAVARAITTASTCPAISFDGGAPVQMAVHAAAAVEPIRPTAYDDFYSQPAAFPVTTCDAAIPAGTAHVALGQRALPAPRRHVGKIAILGDSGCRMKMKKSSAGQYQDCNDPTAWPFQAIAGVVAAMQPDLVVHVGDFHYRETACPAGTPCAGIDTWGFGWSSWEPDFFTPAARLMAAAPWVVVRGDHETCDRGGQGWWRFLDPRPPRPGQDCNAAADDWIGNYSEPYVVPLDDDLAAVILDTGSVGEPYGSPAEQSALYTQQVQRGFALASPFTHSLFLNHQPILAYNSPGSGSGEAPPPAKPGNELLQGVLKWIYGEMLFPGAVDAVLSGHVHLAQVTGWTEGLPPTFVAGNSGTNLVTFPSFPNPPTPYTGSGFTPSTFEYKSEFGFMMMERTATGWSVVAYDQAGKPITTCSVLGRAVACSP